MDQNTRKLKHQKTNWSKYQLVKTPIGQSISQSKHHLSKTPIAKKQNNWSKHRFSETCIGRNHDWPLKLLAKTPTGYKLIDQNTNWAKHQSAKIEILQNAN